jgi:hypothetical protein
LFAFGVIGLALMAVAAGMLAASLATVNDAMTGFERQRTEVLAMLGPASSALDRAATSAENAGTSLGSTRDAATRAASLTTRLAESFESLASATDVDFFGTRPFASLGSQFVLVAQDARSVSTDLTTTSTALGTNIDDSRAVAADLRALVTQLDALESSLGGSSGTPAVSSTASLPIGVAWIVLFGLLAWLAVPAIASIWLGWRLIRG